LDGKITTVVPGRVPFEHLQRLIKDCSESYAAKACKKYKEGGDNFADQY